MKQGLWCCIISMFLCAAFSVEAQDLDRLTAVECERLLFQGAAPVDANAALMVRADALVRAGRYHDAADALERLRLYALDPQTRREAALMKALCAYREGAYPSALSFMSEGFPDTRESAVLQVLILAANRQYTPALSLAEELSGNSSEVKALFRKAPREKSGFAASMLSLLPPLGHAYLGEWKGALGVSAATYGSLALMAWQIGQHNWITAILGGAVLLNASYGERNVFLMSELSQKHNEKALEAFLEALEALLEGKAEKI